MSRRTRKRTGWRERLAGEKRASKGRRSQRQRQGIRQRAADGQDESARRRRLTLMLSLLGVGVLLYLMFGTSWFYIYEIDLRGARLMSEEEAYNRSQLEGLSLFWLNPSSVAARLKEEPLIQEALVAPHPPNAARIEIQERLPIAVWQSHGESYFVDAEGVLFGLRGDARRHIVVRDLGDSPVEPGDTVDVNALQAARELTRWMPERRAWDWEAGSGISFLSEEGWRVVLGDQSQVATKINAYQAFKEQHDREQPIVLLDVSVPEHSYYRTNDWVDE